MDIANVYQHALTCYRAGKYEETLRILTDLKSAVRKWPRMLLLEAYVYRETKRPLSEIAVLRLCLGQLELSLEDERAQAATAWSLLGAAYRTIGKQREAVEAFLRSADLERKPESARTECCNALFSASGIWDYRAADFRYLYDFYQRQFRHVTPYAPVRYRHQRLRVGYISPDFREHPVASLLYPLLKHHDKRKFEIYCYAANAKEDRVTELLRAEVDVWRCIAEASDAEAAERIRQDEIDILFDLSVHTNDTRLSVLAYRPAGVQISGIGDVNSTGLPMMDYFLTDRYCAEDAEAMEAYFTEQPLCLPHSHFCYAPLKPMPKPNESAPCVRQGRITFGCFNHFGKVADEMLSLWNCILQAVPDSWLILKHQLFDSEEGREFAIEKLERLGFSIDRVELRGFSAEYLQEYREIDIALDTYPYVGGMTSIEALYMGVPLVSLYGRRHGTRFGYSLLQNIGLGEMAVPTTEAYAETAVMLAKDWELLDALHRTLRARMEQSPLMDGALYAREMEQLYERVCFGER